jgi:serine/threonine protein kinase
MDHPSLPRLKKDRVAGTTYLTNKYLRYWDGTELCCCHRVPTKRKCPQCPVDTARWAPSYVQTLVPVVTDATTLPVATTLAALPHSSASVIPGVATPRIGKNYCAIRKLGGGSFGELYLAQDLRDQREVAMKVEQRSARHPQLMDEWNTYRALGEAPGLPKVYWCGSNTQVHIVVMELLSIDLGKYCRDQGGKVALPKVNVIAQQLLSVLEYVHERGYIHRDLKPENLMFGHDPSSPVCLVDFGLAKRWRDEAGKHVPYREHKSLLGTPRYTSLYTHQGIEQSRRDDLEALAYILIYLAKGRLPWQGIKAATKQAKYELIYQLKRSLSIEDLCTGLPHSYSLLLRRARGLKFTERPPYTEFRALFS